MIFVLVSNVRVFLDYIYVIATNIDILLKKKKSQLFFADESDTVCSSYIYVIISFETVDRRKELL